MEEQNNVQPKAQKPATVKRKCPYTTIGTPQCGAIMAALGAAVAFMLLFMGFWRTLLVAVLAAAGYFIGACANKGESIKRMVNRAIPPKSE